MPHAITFGPRNRVEAVEPSKVVEATAAEALRMVEALKASNEKTTVQDPTGRAIERRGMRELAAEERR